MPRPAFETQYSPRFTETTVAEIELTLMMQPSKPASARRLSIIQFAAAWVRK